ncbi:hypothetical protein [Microvirga massiliensis]|uniref:hypothetical protein n=1 Tax=Microvirga massiliensis TaxID=1033741 RepID=UPI000A843A87|nr:hypothetical protein [Microvirga massiliensis]
MPRAAAHEQPNDATVPLTRTSPVRPPEIRSPYALPIVCTAIVMIRIPSREVRHG